MYDKGFLVTTLLSLSCAIAQQFNAGLPQQGQWNQQAQNGNGFGSQRPLQNTRPGPGQFSTFPGSGISQGQNSFNQFGGNQRPFQNGQQQGQVSSLLGSGNQGQNSFNQFGGSQQQQQSWNNNGAGLSISNQQGSGSGSATGAGSQGSTNINQILWSNSNPSDYQCVINNCRGQSGQWNPICGSDNLVYDNVAIMRCAQQCGRRISFSYAGTCVVTTTAASRKR